MPFLSFINYAAIFNVTCSSFPSSISEEEEVGYVHIPKPCIGRHSARFGHPPFVPGSGRQINAHCDGVGELGTCKTHCPFAEAPLYASAGQGIFDPHFGEQKLCVLCERESI